MLFQIAKKFSRVINISNPCTKHITYFFITQFLNVDILEGCLLKNNTNFGKRNCLLLKFLSGICVSYKTGIIIL